MPRLRYITANRLCRQGQIFIYDFERMFGWVDLMGSMLLVSSAMFDGFVHADIKSQLAQAINMCFEYQSGHAVLPEIGQHGPRLGIRRRADPLQAIDITFGKRRKGITQIQSAEWVNTSATPQRSNMLRLQADDLISMLTYCIDTAFLCNNGVVYQQIVGISMGLHASPQIAKLVCAQYELQFIKRANNPSHRDSRCSIPGYR